MNDNAKTKNIVISDASTVVLSYTVTARRFAGYYRYWQNIK